MTISWEVGLPSSSQPSWFQRCFYVQPEKIREDVHRFWLKHICFNLVWCCDYPQLSIPKIHWSDCWWKKPCITWDVKNPVNNRINYQPQLVSLISSISSIISHRAKVIEALQRPNIYSFMHVPVQSGSNAVLKHMKRKYTVEDFLYLVDTQAKKLFTRRWFQIYICKRSIASWKTMTPFWRLQILAKFGPVSPVPQMDQI